MYKQCGTDRTALRQRELELGLLEALRSRRYEEITVSDLCQKLGIPRKCFYRYFEGKDGALHALIDHTLMEFPGWWEISGAMRIPGELQGFFRFWREKRQLLDALELSGLSPVLVKRASEFSTREQTALTNHVETFWACGLMGMILSWYRGGFAESPEQMAEAVAEILNIRTARCFPQKTGCPEQTAHNIKEMR